jgi:hypothetical protein
MPPRIRQVRHAKNYELELRFSDGLTATLDLAARVVGRGGVFTPLEEVDFFSQVAVDPEAGTIYWPNGVDFCPDVLYAAATGRSVDEIAAR